MNASGYDRLARCYRPLELLAFGHALERARFAHLDHLRDCRSILLLGDGDGRGLAAVCRAAPAARIESVDISAGMLARAARRLSPADRERVTLRQTDILTLDIEPARHDAVLTQFFLDCFTAEQVADIVARVHRSLAPGGLWLYADFAVPASGWPRWHARLWVMLMLGFFRWQVGLAHRELPPAVDILRAAGLAPLAETSWQHGFLHATAYRLVANPHDVSHGRIPDPASPCHTPTNPCSCAPPAAPSAAGWPSAA